MSASTVDLVLVRHGETVWHAENRYAGSSDVPLTSHGLEQAQALAAWAPGAGLAAVWTSHLRRAQDTAVLAAEAAGLAVVTDARLAELDFGRAEGLTRAEMRGSFPAAVRAFQDDAVAHHLPGGEDPRAAVDRAQAVLGDIRRQHPGGRVLVVAHTTLIRLLLCHLLGLPLGRYRHLFPSIDNVALTEVHVGGDGASLIRFNAPLSGPRRPAGRPSDRAAPATNH